MGLSSDFCSADGEGGGGGPPVAIVISGPACCPAFRGRALLGDTGLLGGGELPSNGSFFFGLGPCGDGSKEQGNCTPHWCNQG